MNKISLSTFVLMFCAFCFMGTASSALVAGEEDAQPVTSLTAVPQHTEIPAEYSAVQAPPAAMPTDDFGNELSYCNLPLDYVPYNVEAVRKQQITTPNLLMSTK